jgi:hypothetical protein
MAEEAAKRKKKELVDAAKEQHRAPEMRGKAPNNKVPDKVKSTPADPKKPGEQVGAIDPNLQPSLADLISGKIRIAVATASAPMKVVDQQARSAQHIAHRAAKDAARLQKSVVLPSVPVPALVTVSSPSNAALDRKKADQQGSVTGKAATQTSASNLMVIILGTAVAVAVVYWVTKK